MKNNCKGEPEIPESDKLLLREFEKARWEDIDPERCQSKAAREEATLMMQIGRWIAER